jgi:FkbM family methyltransferase
MKSFFRGLLNAFDDALYLFKQDYSRREKRTLVRSYIVLATKAAFLRTPKGGIVLSRVCGLWVTSFSHTSLFYLFREIFIHGEYHFRTSDMHPVFFDLGANIGLATVYLKWRYPACTIHTFEPDPDTFELLLKNVEQNKFTNVHVYNMAIGGMEGSVDFYTNSAQSGSLRMSVGRERADGKKLSVPMKTLSSFLTMKDAYVKMDTEGSETETIRELAVSGKIANIKEMVIEYHHRINSESSKLSEILIPIEKAEFEYELECANKTLTKKEVYQNVMLYCYRT